MYPAEPTTRLRRFTIFDGTLLTVVMAMAFLAARSTWPRFDFLVRSIAWRQVTDPFYLNHNLLGPPPPWLQLASAPTLVGETLSNTWDPRVRNWGPYVPDQGLALVTLRQGVVCSLPILVYLVFALLLLRVVRPRPAWGEILRQPGCTACLAVAGSLCLGAWVEILAGIRVSLAVAAVAVTMTWVIQRVAGWWQPEPSWIDRTGRVLGLGWVVAGMIVLG